jgi:hypothetical protein
MQRDSFLKRAMLGFLPLMLAFFFLYVLDGGFPPTNWQILAQAMLRPSTYQAEPGVSVQEALTLLWIQAALLALAWGGLTVLAFRELRVLLRGPAQNARSHPLTPAALPSEAFARSIPTFVEAWDVSRTPTNPFEELRNRRGRSGTITLGKSVAAKQKASEPQRKAPPAAPPASPGAARSGRNAGPLPSPSNSQRWPSPPAQGVRAGGGPADPFAVQPEILGVFERPDVLASPNVQRAPQTRQGPDVKPDVKASPNVQRAPQTRQDPDVKAEFVFGNPFEGPLPAVFEYDSGLKQSLADLNKQNPLTDAPPPGQAKQP